MLCDLHFVACRFGLDGFEPWSQVFYESVDFLIHVSSGEDEDGCDMVVAKFLPDHDVMEPTHYSKPRTIFFMLLIQHTLPRLSVSFLENTVFAYLQPYLVFTPTRNNDELDLFEMGHWIHFKLFDGMLTSNEPWKFKSLVLGLASGYTDLVLKNYLLGENLTSTRRMISALLKSLTCFSSLVDPRQGSFRNRVGGYNETNLSSGSNDGSADKDSTPVTESRSNQRGGIRLFKSKHVKRVPAPRKQLQDAEKEEIVDSSQVKDSWNPWEGDDVAWACLEKVEALVRQLSREIDEQKPPVTAASDGNKKALSSCKSRVDEIMEAVPELKLFDLRDGLMVVLFDQIRTVGLPHVDRMLDLIRGFMLKGVNSSSKGLGLDTKDLSKSSLWKGLFDSVSNNQYYDQLRQTRSVEWYVELVAEAKEILGGAKTMETITPPTGALRAKL
ncbi:UNVERIFIED_CONTAM: hypothetical protein HDU68_009024 [Siphonaria sp. JEL0065]|nr:hypothetical protein HDU68_009024 [Siphonaria sp. JEL0065]